LKKPSVMKRVLVFLLILGGLIALLVLLDQLTNTANSDNVYGIPQNQLSRATINLLDDPNYQNVILPAALDDKLDNKESFFVYYFSAACSFCIKTTPILNDLIKQTNVQVDQFNLEVYNSYFAKSNIRGTPTLIFYEKGIEKDRIEVGIENANDQESIQIYTAFFEKYRELAIQ
jgi:thioredoxin 1